MSVLLCLMLGVTVDWTTTPVRLSDVPEGLSAEATLEDGTGTVVFRNRSGRAVPLSFDPGTLKVVTSRLSDATRTDEPVSIAGVALRTWEPDETRPSAMRPSDPFRLADGASLTVVCDREGAKPLLTAVEGYAPSPLPPDRRYRLVWHDEFDGTALDVSKWSYRTNYWGRDAHWFAKPEHGCVEVKDGVVKLKIKKLPNGQFVSPQLQTGENVWDLPATGVTNSFWQLPRRRPAKFEHRYGYWECRCKLQEKRDWWSAFWLQSANIGTTLDAADSGAEIDVLECFNPGRVAAHNVFAYGYGLDRKRYETGGGPLENPTDWHTFGVLWDETGYTFYVDGREDGRVEDCVSRRPLFTLISTECRYYRTNRMTGGPAEGLEAAVRANDAFTVDYVRVWEVERSRASGDAMSPEYRKLWGPSVQAEIDERIEKHRKADAIVAGFKPGTAVEVEQLTHDFKFGAHIFNFDQLGSREANDIYKATFTNLLNAATVAYYWSSYEPVKGSFRHAAGPHDTAKFWDGVAALSAAEKYNRYIEYRRPAPDPILDFCAANGIDAHGHAMIYRVSQPDWVTNATPTDAEQIGHYRAHIRELASHVGTHVSQWDVVNESVRRDASVDAPDDAVFWGDPSRRVPVGYTFACYDEAAKCLPRGVRAAINEACVIDDVYLAFVRSLIDRGAKIDIVGLQFHIFNTEEMRDLAKGAHKGRRGYCYTPARIKATLEKADRLGRPIHISEITIPAPEETPWGEAVQAEALRDLYRLWFSWPSVYRITYWNLVDFTYHKENLASGFYGRDMRKKAVYHVLDRLINHDWKTRLSLNADDEGRISFRGFRGRYRLSYSDVNGMTVSKIVEVK